MGRVIRRDQDRVVVFDELPHTFGAEHLDVQQSLVTFLFPPPKSTQQSDHAWR